MLKNSEKPISSKSAGSLYESVLPKPPVIKNTVIWLLPQCQTFHRIALFHCD